MANLSDKQKAFVREYLKDSNGKQAAIRAGYSPKTAESKASQLLRLVKVRALLEEKTKPLDENAGVTRERVMSEFAKMAFGDDYPRDKKGSLDSIAKILGMFIDRTSNPVLDEIAMQKHCVDNNLPFELYKEKLLEVLKLESTKK